MNKYNKEIVMDYIQGNDIIGYDIDDLENDPLFMMNVIKESNDKRMIQYCGEDVLKDYHFVKFFITKFSNDAELVLKIADNFIVNRKNHPEEILDLEMYEISAIVEKKLRKNNWEKFEDLTHYYISNETFKADIYAMLAEEKKQKNTMYEQLGFNIIEGYLEAYDYLKGELALDFINKLFYEKAENQLNKYIHFIVPNKEYLSEKYIDEFIYQYLMQYDESLANYVRDNMYLVDDLKKEFKNIYRTWDEYERFYVSNRKFMFIDTLHNFYDYNESDRPNFTYSMYEEYILRKLKLIGKFRKNKKEFYDFKNFENAEEMEKIFDLKNPITYKFVSYAVNLAEQVFKLNKEVEFDLYVQPEKKPKQKMILFYIDDKLSEQDN